MNLFVTTILTTALLTVVVNCNVQSSSFSSERPTNSRLVENIEPTHGEPWPKPQLVKYYGNQHLIIRPSLFEFTIVKYTCPIVEDALKRYYDLILGGHEALKPYRKNRELGNNATNGVSYRHLDLVKIHLMAPCEQWPTEEMDESYEIKINGPDSPGEGLIAAGSNWGILHGLETFVQLIHPRHDYTALHIRSVLLVDYPRFPFRALHLDTSRHFLPKATIFENLELMAANKYNVFHWHIVDDESFPYYSKTFPSLSDKGAYHPYTHIYTQKDVAEIIDFARVRGIRVLPEFDTPGHTQSWNKGMPGLLTQCYDQQQGVPDGTFGPIDPTQPSTYTFLSALFSEIIQTFPDKYLHIGGDEVDFTCWESNPTVKRFMAESNFTGGYEELQEYYIHKLVNLINALPKNKTILAWQEVYDDSVALDKNVIVHVWKSEDWPEEIANATRDGYKVVTSSCWYLNIIDYGIDWHKYYTCEPLNFTGTPEQKRRVLGGEACMWTEYVDKTNVIPRTWPRAAVPAERLWSSEFVNDLKSATNRLEEHRCRLLGRGYAVEPINGAGFCLVP